jgi:hypothetical protein
MLICVKINGFSLKQTKEFFAANEGRNGPAHKLCRALLGNLRATPRLEQALIVFEPTAALGRCCRKSKFFDWDGSWNDVIERELRYALLLPLPT